VVSHQNEIFLLIPRSLLRGGFIEFFFHGRVGSSAFIYDS
jgi:hypothetical protein